jgi:hypothetical protein
VIDDLEFPVSQRAWRSRRRGGPPGGQAEAIHTGWWIVAGLGLVIFALGLIGFKREKWDLGHIT